MLSASMITWLTPTISVGRADGNEHAPELLPSRAAGHRAELVDVLRHARQRERRGAHHRRRGEDACRQHRRDRAVPEEDQHRDQVGEGRDRLHQVERRRDHAAVEPRSAPGEDAEGEPDDDAERHGDDDQRQRQHGALPLAEERDVEEAAAGEQRELAPAARVSGDRDGQRPRRPRRAAAGRALRGRCRSCNPWRAPRRRTSAARRRSAAIEPRQPGDVRLQPRHCGR